jgi:hypothetical protein
VNERRRVWKEVRESRGQEAPNTEDSAAPLMTKRALGSSRDRAAGSVKSSNRRIQLLASLKVGGSEMRARGASRGR